MCRSALRTGGDAGVYDWGTLKVGQYLQTPWEQGRGSHITAIGVTPARVFVGFLTSPG